MENSEGQELLQCPYEKNHQILRNRMQVHLGKCRRNHTNLPKVTCPFNVTHVLNEPELKFHVTVCSERKTFEAFRHADEPTTSPTPAPPMPHYQSEENWDDDADVPSYNPQQYVSNAAVLRLKQGAPPAERKKFRQEERMRILSLDK